VLIGGKHHYLGKHGSKASKELYARLLMERAATPQPPSPSDSAGHHMPDLLVCELLLKFIEHAERYYVHQDGQHATATGEIANIRDAMRPVRALYDTALACDFGPRALKAVRQYMIDTEGLSRKVVNNRVNRIRRIFKWAVSEELLPSSVYEALRTVDGLRYGRTHARETKEILSNPVDGVLIRRRVF